MFYYRGGKICLTDHFKPLWARNVPKFGIAHAMALGVSSIFSRHKNLQLILFILSHISLPSIVPLCPHPLIVIACYFRFCICFNFWYDISNFLPIIICSTCTCISSLCIVLVHEWEKIGILLLLRSQAVLQEMYKNVSHYLFIIFSGGVGCIVGWCTYILLHVHYIMYILSVLERMCSLTFYNQIRFKLIPSADGNTNLKVFCFKFIHVWYIH